MRRFICIAIACLIIIATLSGCGMLQKLGLQADDNDELRPVSSVVMYEDEADAIADMVPIRLYFTNEDSTKLFMEVRYISMEEATKSVNSIASTIVKELINGPDAKSGLKRTIPEGAKLRSPVSISGNIATVDFTKEFVDNHPGGKSAEQITIFSIVNSLTELKEVEKVRFTINGKKTEKYKGNYQFDAPFPRSPSLISDKPLENSSAITNDVNGGTGSGDSTETSGEAESEEEILE